jgi:hypothetical protein
MTWKKYVCTLLVVPLLSGTAAACTLFAATGSDWVEGGGTLIVKNRDWRPDWQEMRLVDNDTYRYYGIFAGDVEKSVLRAGINEKGLVVMSATASSIPTRDRRQMPQAKLSALRTMLGKCATVDEALSHSELFLGPKFLLLADAHKIAYLEVAPEGKYRIREVTNGPLAHTNHYLEPKLQWANYKSGTSSLTRYNRITELLDSGKQPYTLDDFVTYSQDQHDGPDNSIWRTGSNPKGGQTVATLAVRLQENQLPQLYLKIRTAPDKQGQEEIRMLSGEDMFPPKTPPPQPTLWESLWQTLKMWWKSLW